MHYYPVMDSHLEVCKSSVSDAVLESFFVTMNKYDLAPTNISTKSIGENFNSIRWTPLTSSILSRVYDVASLSFSCNSSEGVHISKAYSQNMNGVFEVSKLTDKQDRMVMSSNYAPINQDLSRDCE